LFHYTTKLLTIFIRDHATTETNTHTSAQIM